MTSGPGLPLWETEQSWVAQRRWSIVPVSVRTARETDPSGRLWSWHPGANISSGLTLPRAGGAEQRQRQKQEAVVILITKLYLVNTLD